MVKAGDSYIPVFLIFCTKFCSELKKWWRRRESNPRPKTFHSGVYILIPNFSVRQFRPPLGTMSDQLVCLSFTHPDANNQSKAILQVDALTGSAGRFRQDTGLFKRPGHIHNHLRLCFNPTCLRVAGISVCNLNFFIPVEAVSPPENKREKRGMKKNIVFIP